jgi:hypothetical protein
VVSPLCAPAEALGVCVDAAFAVADVEPALEFDDDDPQAVTPNAEVTSASPQRTRIRRRLLIPCSRYMLPLSLHGSSDTLTAADGVDLRESVSEITPNAFVVAQTL